MAVVCPTGLAAHPSMMAAGDGRPRHTATCKSALPLVHSGERQILTNSPCKPAAMKRLFTAKKPARDSPADDEPAAAAAAMKQTEQLEDQPPQMVQAHNPLLLVRKPPKLTGKYLAAAKALEHARHEALKQQQQQALDQQQQQQQQLQTLVRSNTVSSTHSVAPALTFTDIAGGYHQASSVSPSTQFPTLVSRSSTVTAGMHPQQPYYTQQQQQQQQQQPYYPQQLSPLSPPPSSHSSSPSPIAFTSQPSLSPAQLIANNILNTVASKQLGAFYNDARLAPIISRLTSVNFAEIAHKWRLYSDIVYDLAPLALYDVIFFIDDSGSILFDEGGERWDDLVFILSNAADVVTRFDDDGVQLTFLKHDREAYHVKTTEQVQSFLQKVSFTGQTPLGTKFSERVLGPRVVQPALEGRLAKPVLAIIITDGEPTGEAKATLANAIKSAQTALMGTPYGAGVLSIQIGQVGSDKAAQAFLQTIDRDPAFGGMVDCTSNYEMEAEEWRQQSGGAIELTPEMWLLKLCVGAIDPSYDSRDTQAVDPFQ
ncbi:hypothetical protein BC831DRAFT_482259 [Entophlyctis helioformis]|nr:hypothetical protein BC831DRAFT_482259 [Entophlyctis helioformis]